jgi:hypothetical protein
LAAALAAGFAVAFGVVFRALALRAGADREGRLVAWEPFLAPRAVLAPRAGLRLEDRVFTARRNFAMPGG